MAFTQTPIGGGVPNVDLITQTLAKLQPDSALQNYARMHKNDPYILSLATAESNRRKALRLAAQGQNAGLQQTVADQNIASMAPAPVMTGSGGTLQTGYGGPVMTGMASGGLPEDQGIAQLPTPNMQRMADGGIAGYEDDEEGMATGGMGGIFNFAQQSEPVLRMAGGGGGLTEMRKLVLKELGETPTKYLQDPDVKRTVDKLVQERLGATATTATAAKPAAAPAAAPTKAFEAGEKFRLNYGPTIKKVGDTLSNIGTTKDSKLPLGGAVKTAGVFGAIPAGYEAYQQSDFYNDPNVSNVGKAKQMLGTASKVGIPMLTTGLGSFFGPLGTTGGMIGGGALTAYLDQTGRLTSQEYDDWLKANPQATPEQTKKAAAKFIPTYSPNDQDNSEAQRLGLKVNPNTMSKLPEAKEPAPTGGAGVGGQGGAGGGAGSSAQSIKDMYALFAGDQNKRDTQLNEIERQYKELAESRTSAAQRDYNQLQTDIAARGEYGKDREAKLKSKEERIGKEEGQSSGLALLEAGLAMMSGTSQHAFANIGQGAMVGTAAYRKSMEKITDARDKLDDAYGRLEDVRFNQKSMDSKELRAAKKGVDDATNAGLDSLIGYASKRFDITTDQAKTMFGGAVNLEQSRIAAAPGIARNKMLEKQFEGDNKKMVEYGKIQKQVLSDLEKDIEYKTASTPEAKNKIMETRLRAAMMNNPFLSAYAMGIGFESAPKSKIRNEDEPV